MLNRIRMRIARWLDRSQGFCWSRLVVWAAGYYLVPWGEARGCKAESERDGMCWCGKFCRQDIRELQARGLNMKREPWIP
jgi:hypothetical protein